MIAAPAAILALVGDPAVVLAVRAGLALLFAAAAVHKLRDRVAFAGILQAYRLLPPAVVPAAVVAIAAAELATAAALLVPGGGTAAVAGVVALLALYAGAIAINLARGRRTIDCGCGAPGARQTLSAWLVVRNAGLALAALATLGMDALATLGRDARATLGTDALATLAANAAYAPHALDAHASRTLGWLDVLTVAGAVAVAACLWSAAHGLAAAAARVRAATGAPS